MPELPEVEAQRQLLGQWAVGLEIATAVLFEQGGGPREGLFDDKVFGEEQTPATVSAALEGAHVLAARRKGKQLWLELGDAKGGTVVRSLLLHFGMTGAVVVKGAEAPLYKSFEIDTGAWPPRFTKLELILADRKGSMSATLAFCDPRRFGRILIRQGATPLTSPPLSKLAADPICDPPTVGEFGRALSRSSAPVKAVLLDQTKVVCGVGNWIADEVFYQASVLPSTRCDSLSQDQIMNIYTALIKICTTACTCLARSADFPKNWLFHFRWANQTAGSIPSPIGRIHFETVGGRTTAFCPATQKGGAAIPAPKETEPKKTKPKKTKVETEAKRRKETQQPHDSTGQTGQTVSEPKRARKAKMPKATGTIEKVIEPNEKAPKERQVVALEVKVVAENTAITFKRRSRRAISVD